MKRLYRIAFALAVITVLSSIVEGIASTYFGYEDESLTLLGFGADSFIEMISGLGIAHDYANSKATRQRPKQFRAYCSANHRVCLLYFSGRTCDNKHLQFVDRTQANNDNGGSSNCGTFNSCHVGPDLRQNKGGLRIEV